MARAGAAVSTADHAFLPPSSAHIWRTCAMWPTMNARFPETEPSPKALEGNAAHWVLHEAITRAYPPEGSPTPFGLVVTEEMLEGAELFKAAIRPLEGQKLYVEQKVVNSAIHVQNFGTPDLWTFDNMILDVVDYKFGHEFVEVFENQQLINYTGLILKELNVNGMLDQQIRVRHTIVQPRSYTSAGPVRSHVYASAADLRGHFNLLRAAAESATRPEPVAVVNPGCDYCPGRHACTVLQRTAQRAADLSGHFTPVELDPLALGNEWRMLKRAADALEARLTGLEQQAVSLWHKGQIVPHTMIERGAGRRVWAKPAPEVTALGAMFGKDLSKPGLVTPAQAEKLGIPEAVVKSFTTVPGGSIRLVADDGSKARKVFG